MSADHLRPLPRRRPRAPVTTSPPRSQHAREHAPENNWFFLGFFILVVPRRCSATSSPANNPWAIAVLAVPRCGYIGFFMFMLFRRFQLHLHRLPLHRPFLRRHGFPLLVGFDPPRHRRPDRNRTDARPPIPIEPCPSNSSIKSSSSRPWPSRWSSPAGASSIPASRAAALTSSRAWSASWLAIGLVFYEIHFLKRTRKIIIH